MKAIPLVKWSLLADADQRMIITTIGRRLRRSVAALERAVREKRTIPARRIARRAWAYVMAGEALGWTWEGERERVEKAVEQIYTLEAA